MRNFIWFTSDTNQLKEIFSEPSTLEYAHRRFQKRKSKETLKKQINLLGLQHNLVKADEDGFSEEMIQHLKEMVSQNITIKEMATELKVLVPQLNCKLKALNLKTPRMQKNQRTRNLKQKGLVQCPVCHQNFPLAQATAKIASLTHICINCINTINETKPEIVVKSILDSRFRAAKRRSKTSNLEFTITQDDLWNLWVQQNGKCAYSGVSLGLLPDKDTVVSIDRIDSSLGYTPTNTALCCFSVNSIKTNWSKTKMLEWIKAIYLYNKSPK
jgi:hypothetical protein